MTYTHDLIVLVADGNMKSAFEGILERSHSLEIRQINFEIIKATGTNDPGCVQQPEGYLRGYLHSHEFAIVVLDYQGSGQEDKSVEDIQDLIQKKLIQDGWTTTDDEGQIRHRAEVIVIDPELENWVWTKSPNLSQIVGWKDHQLSLKDWLEANGLWLNSALKPSEPKAALEKTLRFTKKPRSSSIYKKVAEQVSLRHCSDRSYTRLTLILKKWFA